MQGTIIIYLIGKPGTGKYTIAQELAQFKYIVCDNHLVDNPIFTIFNYDDFMEVPQLARDAIKKIKNTVLSLLYFR
ncbi:hypothetical protein [Cardinium endosymbiont of Oedothorax gibbosus]|uniref:hypothetical protein n=1 Tax=Cardinium endosymbiont of Oedothorax gibbosus TaxID=931101 RepID=UPI0020242439|nr:hypothetical protein [Cardinium endosymbiont of Oedothorax gibbosus]